jgi:hypothetical protein
MKLKGIDSLREPDINGRTILKRILNKFVSGLHSTDSGQNPMATSCEHNKKPSGSIKREEIIEQLNNCHLLHKELPKWG